MAEKNTHSILETIKRKMLKLDQKAEKQKEVSGVNNSNSEDEFEDISSGDKKEQKVEEVKKEAVQPIDKKFEDDLGLDIEKSEEKKDAEAMKAPKKAAGSESFKDFNLDDLDLDDEEKTFATSPQITAVKKDLAATSVLPDSVLDASEIDKSEDEVEVEDSAAAVASIESSGDVGPVDWLGNPINSSALEPEDELLNDEEEHEEMEESEEENHEESEDDLDLEHEEKDEEGFKEYEEGDHEEEFDEEGEDLEKDLEHEDEDLEEDEDQEHEEDDLDLDNLDDEEVVESAPTQKELPSFDAHLEENDKKTLVNQDAAITQKQNKEVLEDELEFLENSGSEIKPAEALQKEKDDFDFTDLEQEDDIFSQVENNEMEKEVVVENNNKEMENIDPLNLSTPQQNFEPDNQVSESDQPQIEKHEIDLEFEKELMGFTSNVSDSFSQKPVMPEPNQPIIKVMPMQDESLPKFEEKNSLAKSTESKSYESTVSQVSDSVKRLIDAKNVVSGISSFSQSPALAELALHLMEPKIEKWFNDNLPELVERVVREEIKKMIPRE